MSVKSFIDSVGARSSIPGGGCVSALTASLGSSLACMVANLTYGNRKFESVDKQIRQVLPAFYDSYNELMLLIDQDAAAFNSYVDALKLPDVSPEEKLKYVVDDNSYFVLNYLVL
jgi:formiminotetrahydrofolate cyclodeaminase